MATLSSRIHDLAGAIVAALNARQSSAASGYDVAKLNGYTGTQAQWLADFSDPGNTDYAAQFNGLLTPVVPTAGIASETNSGVTQLATLAQTMLGTSKVLSVSPYNLAQAEIATSFADLNTKAAGSPSGAIFALTQQQLDASNALYRSVWYVNAGVALPLLPMQASSATALPLIKTAVAAQSALGLDPFNTYAVVGGSSPRDEYIYVGATTGFYLWKGAFSLTNGSKYSFDARSNYGTVDGRYVDVAFSVSCNSGQTVARDDTVILAGGFNAPNTVFIQGAMSAAGGAWASCSFWVLNNQINMLTTPAQTASGTILAGSGRWQRQIPTV